MEWEDSYFEDEVRDGFYVPSIIKRAWAAQLEVLSEVDRICKKYNISYFADWGTLLGAVRHGGFIPWDDDMDISMKRADYNRFMSVAREELPEGYDVYNYKENEDYWGFVTRVVAKRRICFEEEHLKKFHGFPYIVGIDIFLLDYVCADEEREMKRNALCNYILGVADGMAEGRLTEEEAETGLRRIETICSVKLDRRQNMNQLRVQLYDIVADNFAAFSEEEACALTRMMPDGLHGNKKLRLPKKYYDEMIWMKYENTGIPVPAAYDEMLTRRYGDYMKLVRDAGGHDYPFFKAQRQQLQKVLDFDIPHFTFSQEMLNKERINYADTLKGIAEEYKNNSQEIYEHIQNNVEKLQQQETLDLIANGQQYAIDFANLIEQCKGEGYVTVVYLEEYCELIYQVYMAVSEDVGDGRVTGLISDLKNAVDKVNVSIDKDILKRKEIVFLPYKAAQWNAIDSVYRAAVQDENCDVYVIPVPYYYKEYDGTFYNMQYEGENFPKDISVTKYDTFDFGLHAPDVIVIQNPYDEWNQAVSAAPFFYSSNLKKYTDKLVYIPPFKVEEFSRNNHREYYNMQYYCTVPGVVNADVVVVQSENMRQLYIEKMTEFAGEKTRSVWEAKIIGSGSPLDDCTYENVVGDAVMEAWKSIIYREDGTKKKLVHFHVEVSSLIQHQERAVSKIKEVLEVFYENKEDVALIWSVGGSLDDAAKLVSETLCESYKEAIRSYREQGWGIYADAGMEDACTKLCDAYYGDAGRLGHECVIHGKPVMICSY